MQRKCYERRKPTQDVLGKNACFRYANERGYVALNGVREMVGRMTCLKPQTFSAFSKTCTEKKPVSSMFVLWAPELSSS